MVLAICYRVLTVIFKDNKFAYLVAPFFAICEESAKLRGKLLGLAYIENNCGVVCPHE